MGSLTAPLRPLVEQALRQLRLPLWNPYEAGGQPLFAQAIHAVLHPISLLGAFLAPGSVDFLIVAGLALASSGAFAAARCLGASRTAALAGALAYGWSGYALGASSFLNILAGAASAPWVVAGLRLAASGSGAGWALGAVAVCAGAFSGDIQMMAAVLPVGAALAFEAGGVRGLARAAGSAALGLVAAGIQLVPAWAALAESVRAAPGAAAGGQWALAPARLAELLVPGLFVGVPHSYRAPVFEALGGPSQVPFPFLPSVFVGAPVLLAALLGARRSRTGLVLLGLGALSLWAALGDSLGATRLTSAVPLWSGFRYPEKMVGPLTLCLALGAALGADQLRLAGPRWRAAAVAAAASLGLLALGAFLLPAPAEALLRAAGAGQATGLLRARLASGGLEASAGLWLLAALPWLRDRGPAPAAAALAGLFLCQGAAAARFAVHAGVALPAALPPLPSSSDGTPVRLFTPLHLDEPPGGAGDGIDRQRALEARLGRPPTNARAGVDNVESNSGVKPLRAAVVQAAAALRVPLARRFSATHLVAPRPEDAADEALLAAAVRGGRLLQGPDRDGVAAWEIPHRPWAFFATGVRLAPTVREAARALGAAAGSGDDRVVLEADAAPPLGRGRVLQVTRQDAVLAVEAEAEGPALLVLNDAFAEGWNAWIDGAPVEILAADVLVRAVRWPTGRHRLEMRYQPPSLALGKALSGLGLAGLLLGLLLWLRRARARAPPAT